MSQRPVQTRRDRRAQERAERAGRPRASRAPAPRPWWQSPFVLVTGAAILAGVAFVLLANPFGRNDLPTTGDGGIQRPINPVPEDLADGPALGEADAPVLLEVYSDYQCPVCGRFALDQLPQLAREFVASDQLRIVDKPIAILGTGTPDESLDAAVGAVCAGRQDRYWAYHDLLMANQDGENEGAFSRETLVAMADEAELDRAGWDTCFADATVAEQVRRDTQTAVGAGINATPTFVLNGQRIVGLVEYDVLAQAIRDAAGASGAPSGSVAP